MKSTDTPSDFVRMPHDLLARAQAVADKERRTADDLVRDAVQCYLDSHPSPRADETTRSQARPAGRKSLAQLFAESPFKGLDLKLERDSDTGRPPVNL